MVVGFHASYLLTTRGLDSWLISEVRIDYLGAAGVDLFFVISGCVVSVSATRAQTGKQFFLCRLKRIWPLYLIATAAYLAIHPFFLFRPLDLLTSLALVQPFGTDALGTTLPPGWTLMFEFDFYVLIVLAMWWTSSLALCQRIAVLIVSLTLVGYWVQPPWPLRTLSNPIVFEFLFGVVVGWAWTRNVKLPLAVAGVLLLMGGAWIGVTAIFGSKELYESKRVLDGALSWQRVVEWGMPAAMIVAAMVLRSPILNDTGRWMSFLGDASYSIYLFHIHVLEFIERNFDMLPSVNPNLLILGAGLVAVLAGIIMHLVVERPIMRWFKSRRPMPQWL